MNIILSFATETAFSTRVHDLILELAEYLTAQGWRGNFHLTGDFARALRRYARCDVIRALARHEIGYHCNHHGGRPFMPGYCETESWDQAVATWLHAEMPGISLLREMFDRTPAYYTTEFAKAPQTVYAAWLAGIPAIGLLMGQGPAGQTAALPDGGMGAAWYCNNFVPTCRYLLSVPERPGLEVNMQRALDELAGQLRRQPGVLRAFMHEYVLFYDKSQPFVGSTYAGTHYEDMSFTYLPDAVILENIASMKKGIAILAAQPAAKFISFTDYREKLYHPGHGLQVDVAELDVAARQNAAGIDAVVLGNKSLAPAEIAGLLVRALRIWRETKNWPAHIAVRGLLGPVEMPAPAMAAGVVSGHELLAGLVGLDRDLDDRGCLPCNIAVGPLNLGTGQWVQALVRLYGSLRQNHAVPEQVELPADSMPAVAADPFFQQTVFTRPIYPAGFTGQNICRLCRLQSWSWKPAILRSEII